MKNTKKFIPMAAIAVMGILVTAVIKSAKEPLSVNTILRYTPENGILAAGILLSLFALKSLTVVFPISLLYLTSGILFPPIAAVFISAAGLAIALTVPYWIGKYSGKEAVEEICQKYPKAEQVAQYQKKNAFFACFITRIVGFLPCDIVSMYFGACDTAYLLYLTAGVAGSLLSVVTTTLLGEQLSDPFSAAFMIVLLCRVLVSGGAVAINHGLKRREI